MFICARYQRKLKKLFLLFKVIGLKIKIQLFYCTEQWVCCSTQQSGRRQKPVLGHSPALWPRFQLSHQKEARGRLLRHRCLQAQREEVSFSRAAGGVSQTPQAGCGREGTDVC